MRLPASKSMSGDNALLYTRRPMTAAGHCQMKLLTKATVTKAAIPDKQSPSNNKRCTRAAVLDNLGLSWGPEPLCLVGSRII